MAAIVTGAAGTIGSSVVRRLIAQDIEVLAVDVDEVGLKSLQQEFGNLVVPHTADTSDPTAVEEYAEVARARWGTVDRFFNNAGISGSNTPVVDYSLEEFDRVIAINLRGVFLGLKHVLPILADNGSVVNTSSGLGIGGAPGTSAYAASKHGVVGLTKVCALEQAKRGVRVNAVCPGPVAGPMTSKLEADAFGDSGKTFSDTVPLGRLARPDEIAAMVVWLLSPDASFVSGDTHTADGGQAAL